MSDEAFGQAIHRRLLEGDPVASAELCERWLQPLVDELSRAYPRVARRDESMIADAAIDALLGYIRNPSIYRPERGPLRTFLYFAARGDLLNALARQRRRRAREVPDADVEDRPWPRNIWQSDDEGPPFDGALSDDERAERWRRLLAQVPDERDRRVLELMGQGVRSTARFAAVLGIEDLDLESQRREVKRHKDRLIKWLRRRWGKRHE
ncbi:MAG TPA: sigma factor [Chloroflexota bacterium]